MLPPVIIAGRKPDVRPCMYCHLANGNGPAQHRSQRATKRPPQGSNHTPRRRTRRSAGRPGSAGR